MVPLNIWVQGLNTQNIHNVIHQKFHRVTCKMLIILSPEEKKLPDPMTIIVTGITMVMLQAKTKNCRYDIPVIESFVSLLKYLRTI